MKAEERLIMIDLEREEALAKMEPEKLERELQFLVQK